MRPNLTEPAPAHISRAQTTDRIDTIADGVAGRCPIPAVLDDLLAVADHVPLVEEHSRHCHGAPGLRRSRWPGSRTRMNKISYSGYRFPPEIIQQAIWFYLRFTLSLRDVEDLLAERGVAVSYETVRRWVYHFGPMIAADLRKIDGRTVYLWRAVDAEGEVLDVQSERNKHA